MPTQTHDPAPTPQRSTAPSRRLAWLPFLLVALLAGGGLLLQRALTHPSTSVSSGTGPLAPAVVATTVDGEHFSLAAARGKAVVLFFMTTNCDGCVAETHALGQLARLDKTGKLSILMVAMTPQSDTPEAIREYRTRNQGPDRYWVVDQGGAITQAYGITALTSTVLIDHTGHIAAHYTSTSLDLATLQTAVRPLV